MEMCDEHEVAFNSRNCPACELEDRMNKLQEMVDERDSELKELRQQNLELEDMLSSQGD